MTALFGFQDCLSVSGAFPAWAQGSGAFLRWAPSPPEPAGAAAPCSQLCLQCSELGRSCSPFRNGLRNFGHASSMLHWEIVSCLLVRLFFSFFFFPSLSEGLHHLPVFHSLGSRGKEWNKSTCCFYQVNLCDVAWSEEFYILSI